MNTISLDALDLALAATLLLANAALSLALQLHIARKLFVSAVRMVTQLLLVGLVLKELFEVASPLWTGLAALVMVLLAGREIMARQEHRLRGPWSFGLGTSCMLAASFLVTVFALTTQVRPDPWYEPRYALPLLGMVLGNTMTGISLGLHGLAHGLLRERPGVEAQLCLGRTRLEASLPVLREALRSALMPILNSMAAAGAISLPGMMTGQILAGAPPVEAVEYQILIFFLIAGGTTFGSVAAVFGAWLRLTDRRHRLRLDRLRNQEGPPETCG